MPERYVMGIDLGTTTCRCAIFDLDGNEIAAAYLETPVSYPEPLRAEVDPDDWWTCSTFAVRRALERSGVPPESIAGIGLSGLMHAPVLLDDSGRPVTPAMLWMDQRCAPQVEAMNREDPNAAASRGRPYSTTWSAPKMRWLAENLPDVLGRARMFMLPKDYVRFRLTGVAGTDPSDAGGTGLYDREIGEWIPEVARLARVPDGLLPPIRPTWESVGRITPEAAAATGLAVDTPVAMGGADTYCTRIGVGPMGEGDACIYMGTAAWISFMGRPGPDGRPVIRGFGATSTTGAALRWARDLVMPPVGDDVSATYDAATAGVELIAPGADDLLCLPHLMGERGPVPDPLARGALVGLTLRHGRAHVVRAVLEGTCFQIRRLLDARGDEYPARAITCGGAARSELWMQLLADITGVEVRVPAITETSVIGAAMLGAVAAGLMTIDEAPARMARPGRTFRSDPALKSRYDGFYARYVQLDNMLAPWFRNEIPAAAPTA